MALRRGEKGVKDQGTRLKSNAIEIEVMVAKKEQEKEEKRYKGRWKKRICVLGLNLFLMLVIVVFLLWGSMYFLRGYTRFYDVVTVPKLQGLSRLDAQKVLEGSQLRMEIVDSVYNEHLSPGVIIDCTPKSGSTVKRDRLIFVTINNLEVKKAIVPSIYEMSKRQAEAVLRRAGFVNISTRTVPGEFSGLALGLIVANTSKVLSEGDTIPYNTPLIIEITSNDKESEESDLFSETPLEEEESNTEKSTDAPNWF